MTLMLHKAVPAALVAAVAAIGLLAACGSGEPDPGQTGDPDPGQTTEEPTDEPTEEPAKADLSGELTIYSQVAQDVAERIDAAFLAEYPNVEITLRRLSGSSGEAENVFVAEARAGSSPADVVFGGTPGIVEDNSDLIADLQDAGVTGLDEWPAIAHTDKYIAAVDGLWGVGYNTTLVDPEDVPTSWEDLLNSDFTGNCVTLEIRGKNPGLISWSLRMQETYGDEFLEGIAELDCQVTDTGQLAGQLLGSGGAAIAFPVFPSHVNPVKGEGAPVEYVLLTDPLTGGGKYVYIPEGAPNKELAAAFVSWFLTPAGQTAACADGTYGSPLAGVEGCGDVASVEMVQPDWGITSEKTEELARLMGIS